MRVSITLLFLLCSLLGPGCSLCTDCAHQLSKEAVECVDQTFERARDRRWAETAWQLARAADPRLNDSEDYARGFKDGFVDFLFAGGSIEPPPLPPQHYRRLRYQTPEGYQAIQDWFAGYRHGAAVAKERDYRRWVTGPSSLALVGPAVQEQARVLLPPKNNDPEAGNSHVDQADPPVQEKPVETTMAPDKELPPRVEILQVSGPPSRPESGQDKPQRASELAPPPDAPGEPAREANHERRVKIIKITTSPDMPPSGDITLSGSE